MKVTRLPSPASRWTPLAISDHELLHPIASGSYGEVWLARNAVGTPRAVKIVRRGYFERVEDFEREFKGLQNFEPVSRSHEGFVDILQIGRQDDWFYYVMELADDGSESRLQPASADEKPVHRNLLTPDRLKAGLQTYAPRTLRHDLRTRGALAADEVIGLGLELASALAHLHAQGLVHRDVKPSNILFVEGVPKLADAGLVAAVDDARSLVGTTGYIAPEGPGTPQADLYALGKVLYEAAFGKDRQDFPQLPSDLASRTDHTRLLELNEVIVRACAHDMRQRYQSAEQMRGDLALLRTGKSIKAHHFWQHRLRVGRNIGLAVAAVILAATVMFFLWQAAERPTGPVLSPTNDVGTKNAKAAEAYQRGLSAMRRSTTEAFILARDNFVTATEADPKFMAAYARLFETYLMSEDNGGVPVMAVKTEKLNELSAKLVKLDPTNAETHAALAITLFVNDWKWSEAEREFKQALEADPNCRMALMYYGYFLTRLRRVGEAKSVLQRALKLDLTSPLVFKFLGHCELIRNHYEQALNFYRQATESEPSYPSGYYWAGRAYLAMTNYDQALVELEKYMLRQGYELHDIEPKFNEFRKALQKGGPRAYWTKCIELADRDVGRRELRPYMYAEWYARLGDQARAMDRLEKARNQHDSMEHLLVDEFWDEFRKDPGFKDVLKKVGLDAWAQ